ncbi:hypothetical protein BDN70DRAFT_885266, partial [Pholiota conissans]
MLSHLFDIPASIFPLGSVRWTLSWIIILSAAYTYFVNQLSQDTEAPILRKDPDPERTRQYFAQLRRLQNERRALDEKRRRIVEGASFRLLHLPPEIALLVLAHAADWPSTYLSLVQVSRRCQWLTFHACLPHMPIRLITPEQVRAFDLFLRGASRVQLIPLVRYAWVTPLKEASLDAAVGIVKKCTNLQALATNAYIVQEAVTLRGGARLSHLECKDLTLLSMRTQVWTNLLSTANGTAFFAQLTRLRLIGDRVPMDVPLPNLKQLSYGTSGWDEGAEHSTPRIGLAMFDDREMYPALQTVIFTRPRGNAGGLRVSRPEAKKRLFMLELPPTNTELEIWCDSASHRGMWELCAGPSLQSLPRKHLRVS